MKIWGSRFFPIKSCQFLSTFTIHIFKYIDWFLQNEIDHYEIQRKTEFLMRRVRMKRDALGQREPLGAKLKNSWRV